jgi:hypothetical protein
MCQEPTVKKIPAVSKVIAEKCGVSYNYVRSIMMGRRRVRSEKSRKVAAEINRIAEILELTNNNNKE